MKKILYWFRRDLRVTDNTGLFFAQKSLEKNGQILPIFIFDSHILGKLENKNDRRVQFIVDSLIELNDNLQNKLNIYYGKPEEIIPKLVKEFSIDEVHTNRDYETYAINRDQKIKEAIKIPFHDYKDVVFFEHNEVLKNDFNPYTVYTPYSKKWHQVFLENEEIIPEFNPKKFQETQFLYDKKSLDIHKIFKTIPFESTADEFQFVAGETHAKKLLKDFSKKIKEYKNKRDFPAIEGTSNLATYLRFGNISIRQCLKLAVEHKDSPGGLCWMNELIWREFYFQIQVHFRPIEKGAFRPEYDQIKWLGGKKEFKAWCDGMTGFPIVDAAMRCFKQTGQIHNRLRMIVASFLCKTLLVDWKWGEHYFSQKLMDFELASNNGGWQWASSSGCDAAPYFRIFNPHLQSEKFDPEAKFIKKWCPELANLNPKLIHHPELISPFEKTTTDYPEMIVDYKLSRDQALEMYKIALAKK